MDWLWRLDVASNERAVANARVASTLLSRQRVEREEIALYLQGAYAEALAAPVMEVAR